MSFDFINTHLQARLQDALLRKRHVVEHATARTITVNDKTYLNFASNDYRLAKSQTTTLGLKYGYRMAGDSEISTRFELITQTVDDAGVAVTEQTPDLDSILFQVGYNFKW